MTHLDLIRPDVVEVLWDQYCKAIKYQRLQNQIEVKMSFEEFVSLWSKHRINTIAAKLDQSAVSLRAYLTGIYRPVCSWVSKDARVKGGVMTVEMAKIRTAEESKRLFQFQPGDKHTDEARKAIGDSKRDKKQSPEQVAKRTASRVATMARKRAERLAAQNGGMA